MRFIIGPPPDDTDFAPEQEGWQRLREIGPRTLMLVGSLAGVPLAALFSYAWSRIPGGALTFTLPIDAMTLGRCSAVLLPLMVLLSMAVFFAGLIFVCFQRDPGQQFIPVQRRLAERDALNAFSQHTASAVFACPPAAGAGPATGAWIGSGLFA